MKMRNIWKKLSVMLALVMLLSCAAGLTVLAEEGQPAESTVTEPTPEPTAEPTPEPTAEPTPEPTEAPAPVPGANTYVANYTLLNANGKIGNLVRDLNNDVIPTGKLLVTITDERVLAGEMTEGSQVRLIPQNDSVFSAIEGTVTQIGASGDYISYTVLFDGLKYYGGDNTFHFDISYNSLPGGRTVPVSALSLNLPQCSTIEKKGTSGAGNLRAPGLIVKEFDYGGASVNAGSEFTLDLTVFSTTGDEMLNDVTVSLNLPKDVTMATGNSSVYVGTMGQEATRSLRFKILPSANLTGGVAEIGVTMKGIGADSGAMSEGSAIITVPVLQPERFEITKMEGAESIFVGEEGYLEVTFVNKGKEAINNLSAEIMGDDLRNPGQSQYLGNVQPGTENTAEFSIASDMPGTLTGTVVLTYEDAAGNTKTLTKEFSCTVQEMPVWNDPGMMGPDMPMMPEEMPKAGLPVWAWILIGLGAAAVVTVVAVVVVKKRKAKKLAQLEDEDEDI